MGYESRAVIYNNFIFRTDFSCDLTRSICPALGCRVRSLKYDFPSCTALTARIPFVDRWKRQESGCLVCFWFHIKFQYPDNTQILWWMGNCWNKHSMETGKGSVIVIYNVTAHLNPSKMGRTLVKNHLVCPHYMSEENPKWLAMNSLRQSPNSKKKCTKYTQTATDSTGRWGTNGELPL